MWLFNQPSSSARNALIYITVGALTVIWTAVWFLYLHNNPPETNGVYYWCGGLMASGLVLMGIGFGLGQIGKSARHADLPPQEVMTPVATVPPTAAAVPVMPAPVSTPVAVTPTTPVVGIPQVNTVVKAGMAR